MPARDSRFLIIVARRERSVYEQLRQLFEGNQRIEVVVDRRLARPAVPGTDDRRAHDVEASLRAFGWAIVERPQPPSDSPAPARPSAVVGIA